MIRKGLKYCVFLGALVALVACRHKNAESTFTFEQDVRLVPGQYVADEPDNLSVYFKTLCCEHHAEVAVHSNDDDDSLHVWQTVKLLDDYAAGRRKKYPAEDVREALDDMAFELGYIFSHVCYEDTNYAEVFFFRFLEQAVRLSPCVEYVTDYQIADGTVGILNYQEWSPNPLYSFYVYPTASGLRVWLMGEIGDPGAVPLNEKTDGN